MPSSLWSYIIASASSCLKERDETLYVGTRVDKVRRLPGDEWRLIAREIVLDQAVIASHNLSVLF